MLETVGMKESTPEANNRRKETEMEAAGIIYVVGFVGAFLAFLTNKRGDFTPSVQIFGSLVLAAFWPIVLVTKVIQKLL